MDAISSMLTAR